MDLEQLDVQLGTGTLELRRVLLNCAYLTEQLVGPDAVPPLLLSNRSSRSRAGIAVLQVSRLSHRLKETSFEQIQVCKKIQLFQRVVMHSGLQE